MKNTKARRVLTRLWKKSMFETHKTVEEYASAVRVRIQKTFGGEYKHDASLDETYDLLIKHKVIKERGKSDGK